MELGCPIIALSYSKVLGCIKKKSALVWGASSAKLPFILLRAQGAVPLFSDRL